MANSKRKRTKRPLTKQKAHDRAVKGWVTRHAHSPHRIEGFGEWDPDREKQENKEAADISFHDPYERRKDSIAQEKLRLNKKRARHQYKITEKDAKATEEDLLAKGWKKAEPNAAGVKWVAPPKPEPVTKEGYIKTEHVEGLGPKNVFVLHPEKQEAGPDEPIPPRFPRVPGATKPKDVYSIYKPEHRGKQEVFGEWHQPDPDNNPDHWERDREKKGGWGRTIAFEREQSRRAKEARKEGLNYKGYKLFGPQGINPKEAPQQKSDIGIGPNAEHRLESFKWELMDPKGDKNEPSSVTFSLEHEPPRGDSDVQSQKLHPNLESHEPTLPSILSDVGLRGAMIEQLPEENNQWKYRVTLPQDGAQINPDHAALIEERLDKEFTLRRKVEKDNPDTPVADFDYKAPPMRPKVYRVPLASSRSPIRSEDVYKSSVEKLYDKPLNAKIAVRDEEGNLKPGDADVLAVKVGAKKVNIAGHDIGFGDRVGYLNLQERSDAVGWGTSWRPGEQEINRALTAVPRQRDYERLGEALADNDKGDTQKLDSYIKDKYPDADDQQMNRLRDEMKTVGAAVGAAGYYSAKKHGKKSIITRGVNKSWHGVRHIPPIRRLDDYVGISNAKNHDLLNFTGNIDPFTMKYFRMKSRIRHPIRDIDNPHVSGVWNIAPDMPSVRYRERFIANRDVEVPARKIEKEAEKIQKVAQTQNKIKGAIHSEPTTRRRKLDKRITLKTASKVEHDPTYQNYLAGNTHDEKQKEWTGIVNDPKQPLRVRQAAQNSLDSVSKIDPDQIRFTDAEHDVLRANQTKGWVPIEDTKLMNPKVLKAGKIGLVGAAAAGAGIYLYDRHRSHDLQINPNKQSHVRAVVPETIKTPSIKVKRTKSTTIPLNDLTEGLELAGTQIPTGWKASVSMKEHRIKNKKDVSGESYNPGPLVGGVKLRAPVPVERSRTAAVIGTPKGSQIKVAGKSTGLYYEQGKKERWNDGSKKHKLKSANPARVSEKERKQIALLIKDGSPEERERLKQFYSGDEDLYEMINDPEQMEEISKDNKNFYSSKGEVTARDRLTKHRKREDDRLARAFSGSRAAGDPTTLTEERRQKESDRRARADKADRERAGYSPGYY